MGECGKDARLALRQLAAWADLVYDVFVAQERRSEAPEIEVESTADTTDIDEAWGDEGPTESFPAPPFPEEPPVAVPTVEAAPRPLPKPIAPPRPLPSPLPSPPAPPSQQTDVTIEEDDPIEFEADYVSRDSMPTLPDANPLQYDVVPESERVTIPPAPRVPALPKRRRKRE